MKGKGESMDWKRRAALSIAAVTCILICLSPAVRACGPMEERTVFTDTIKPDDPVEEFVRGRLGILEPNYRRIYLLAAYRRLAGPALDPREQAALETLMKQKLKAELFFDDADETTEQEDAAWKEWLKARRLVNIRPAQREGDSPGPAAAVDAGFSATYFQAGLYFRNCLDDAFKTAVRTLGDRIGRFGADSAEVSQWLDAQDQVFANCSGTENIPAPPEPGTHPLIARDRAYQIASAHFYLLHFDKARELFEAIGKDPESPWRVPAPYLVGRVLLRKASLAEPGEGDGSPADASKTGEGRRQAMEILAEAEKQFIRVLEDPEAAQMHSAAREMLQLARIRLRPAESRNRLAEMIVSPSAEAPVDRVARDYTVLLDRFMRERFEVESFAAIDIYGDAKNKAKTVSEFLPSLDREHDLTDWMLTFQAGGGAGLERALKKYDEKGSMPWLIAVLSEIGPGHPRFSSIAAKAARVPEDSPGYGTVSYHLARCALEAGSRDEARKRLDGLLSLAEKGGAARSVVNRLLTLRFALAENLQEVIRYAPRVPVRMENTRERPEGPYFDEDSALLINSRMPLRLLLEMAQSPTPPEHLRVALARALWVRALVLGNDAVALAAANLLKELDAALGPHMKTYLAVKDLKARRYAGVLTILRNPGLRPSVEIGRGRETLLDEIDNYRDNWWDRPGKTAMEKDGAKRPEPAFPDPGQKSAAAKEYGALTAMGSAPTFLCRSVVSYGKENPSAPNLPEALHLAVKSTRFGLTDNETGKNSREAFELLHKKYPKSEWAAKTPYWFK